MKINLFSIGDSNDINTWSNVPYFFARSLTRRNVDVVRLNLDPRNHPSFRCLRLFRRIPGKIDDLRERSTRDVFRTRAYSWIVNAHLAGLSRRYNDADLNLFLTFSFSSYRYSRLPVYHYCDRTYEHHLLERGIRPGRTDRDIFEQEKDNLRNAQGVFHLDKDSDEFVRSRYHVTRSRVLEAGINLEKAEAASPETLIARKLAAKEVLFIGRCRYHRGVDILVEAFRLFNRRQSNGYTLHVLGVGPDDLELRDPRIVFHGYLSKNDREQRREYLDLLASARMFVFPMRPGPIPGVIREAHLMCTPVIMTNVPTASDRVRHNRDGLLVDTLDAREFARCMEALAGDQDRWTQMAHCARDSARESTWDRTIDRFLSDVTSGAHERQELLKAYAAAQRSSLVAPPQEPPPAETGTPDFFER